MESKVQKAARAEVNVKIKRIVFMTKDVGSFFTGTFHTTLWEIFRELEGISREIEKYGLDNKLLNDAVEKTYEALMKEGRYGDAASLAKKYEL